MKQAELTPYQFARAAVKGGPRELDPAGKRWGSPYWWGDLETNRTVRALTIRWISLIWPPTGN